ncbi:MAG: helix-turn-helix transcriptional regulator [Clostridia bacterium]|nr:helix-turn-helix transcriptional regulator [Clostridia bacterium]
MHLNVSEACYSNLESGWKYTAIKPSFTRIYAVIEGSGTIRCVGREIPMTAGNVYILPTEMNVSYICNTDMKKLYFHVNMPQYNGYDILASMKSPAVIENISGEIELAAKMLQRNDTYGVFGLKLWLFQKILNGLELTDTNLGSIEEYSPLVKQIMDYVDNHLKSALSVGEIATALYTSESRIQKAFKAEVGTPLGRYITDRVFFTAEERLRITNHSIKVISEELGFCDSFYFSRLFTKRYGIPPSRYRKQFNL